jgi:chaperonin GroES
MAYDTLSQPDMSGAGSEPAPAAKPQGFTIADLPGVTNIAELLPEDRLTSIGQETWDDYDIDKKSRADKEEIWKKTAEAFNLKGEIKNFPFDKAANVKFPILTVACLQFAARAMPAIVHDGKIAKGKVIGKERDIPQQPPQDSSGAPLPPELGGSPLPPDAPPTPVPPHPPGMGEAALPPEMMPPMGDMGPLPSMGMGGPLGMGGPPQQGTKADQAERIAGYLNYQLLDKDMAWITEMDQALHQLPAFGTIIKKVYRDPVAGNKSELVSVLDFVVNAAYPSLERAPRCTQRFDLYPNEIEERKRDKRFLDIDLVNTIEPKSEDDKAKNRPDPATQTEDKSAPHEFLEQHRLIDLDEDGYQEPYCVTLHVPSKKVVRITASFGENDITAGQDGKVLRIKPYRYFVKYGFIPDPNGGFYDTGFGELLMHPTEVINAIINQLINAGTLATSASGFIGKELRVKGGEVALAIGKYKQLTFGGDDIRKAIVPLQFPEPSTVLFKLLGFLVEQTDKIVSSPEVLTGEAPANQPATTTLALIEQGLKVFTGIIGRVLRSLGHELKVLYELNARHIGPDQVEYFTYGDDEQYVMGQDFDPNAADVVPVADAAQSTDMQRMAKAEMILQSLAHPVIGPLINPVEAAKRFFEAAGISATNLVADQMPKQPPDPKLIDQELKDKEFKEIKKPMAELDGALKQIQLFRAIAEMPPELQQLMGIDPPISNPAQDQEMQHGAEAHEVDMAGREQQMDLADRKFKVDATTKLMKAQQPRAQ